MKRCSRCKTDKPLSDFSKDKSRKDGLQYKCTPCVREIYEENREVRIEKQKQYYSNNKEYYTEYYKQRYQNNKEVVAIYNKQYYEDNKADAIEYSRQYYLNNKEHCTEYFKQYCKQWAKNNPEKVTASTARRRIRKLQAEETMTGQDKQESVQWRVAHKNDTCYYCDEIKDVMTDDHVIPISKGGTDHWYNLERACLPCNSSKRDKSLFEFTIGAFYE